MTAKVTSIAGWPMVLPPIGQPPRIWADAPECCALQAYLDCAFLNPEEALVHQTLASLAVGAHGEALAFDLQPYLEAYLRPEHDDDGIATYLDRPHQPSTWPFLEFYFLTCESLPLVPAD